MWTEQIREMILNGILETLYMTVVSTLFGYVFGLPMGVLLCISDKDGLKPHPVLYKILDFIANIVRSVPFLILLILLIPFTRFLLGKMRIILRVLLVEARTSLITGATIAIGTILGYSAMAGAVGGGGLGDIAVRYGYYRYQTDIMIVTVILLIVIVQIFQSVGMLIANRLDRRKS